MSTRARIEVFLLLIIIVPLIYFMVFYDESNPEIVTKLASAKSIEVNALFGINTDSFDVFKDIIIGDETLATILAENGIDSLKSQKIVDYCLRVDTSGRLTKGMSYFIISPRQTDSISDITLLDSIKYFIYQNSPKQYVVVDFIKDTSYSITRTIKTERRNAMGTINGVLLQAVIESGSNPMLAEYLSKVYQWSIDFYQIHQGDKFMVVYTENFVDGKSIGIERIEACIFTHENHDYYAYYFDADSNGRGEYYNENGESLRKAFLKAPLKFSRISSNYSSNRLHPVLGVFKAHLGTDYAAPVGTPIMTVGDGVVQEAQYKTGNGNYVKIKHDEHISTQYLHMSKIASNITIGMHVMQGQVIGFVGSTGLATGPHVCFRYWKDGKQIDATKMNTMPSTPITKEQKPAFEKLVSSYSKQLLKIKPGVLNKLS